MLTVYGRASSSNVQAVMWTIAELGLDHTRLDYGHKFGGNKTPEYLTMNPNGLVPVLVDGDGPPLFESAAIVRYLAARYGGPDFWPEDPAVRAPLDMWSEWIKTTFGPAFLSRLFWQLMANPRDKCDPDAFAAAVAETTRLATMADARIGKGPWLAGDRFTWADIVFSSLLFRYYTLDFDRADLPNLAAHYERLKARPAYREHVMVSYDVLKAY